MRKHQNKLKEGKKKNKIALRYPTQKFKFCCNQWFSVFYVVIVQSVTKRFLILVMTRYESLRYPILCTLPTLLSPTVELDGLRLCVTSVLM